jgi:hypothetical protein
VTIWRAALARLPEPLCEAAALEHVELSTKLHMFYDGQQRTAHP